MKKNQKGFTLVELIVVIAIAAILSGIAVPTYIAYVDEANKAADIQLASDIGYSIKVASASVGNDIQPGDYIVVGTNGTTEVTGASSVGADEDDYTQVAKAVYKSFGTLASDSTNVKLSYDKWAEESAAADVYDNYDGSSFQNNEEALLSDVQGVTDAFKNFLGEEGGLDLAGDTFVDYMNALGATTDTEIANAAALYVADRSSVLMAPSVKSNFISAWKSPSTGKDLKDVLLNLSNVRDANNNALGIMGATAAGYAMGEAMVQYLDTVDTTGAGAQEQLGESSWSSWYAKQEVYTSESTETGYQNVWNNLNNIFNTLTTAAYAYNSSAVMTYYTDGKAETDAGAYLATMTAISEASSLITDNLSKDNLYDDGTLYDYLTGYLQAGAVLKTLGEDAEGKIVVIAVGTPGEPLSTVCYPIDYEQ